MVSVSTSQQAAALGVLDALLFRRSPGTPWAHLGGLGRGAGWAGRFSVEEIAGPEFVGEVRRFQHREPTRIVGPYYATAGAVVRCTDDVAVILGNSRTGLAPHASDAALAELARLLEAEIEDVSPAKILADETELLLAVDRIADGGPSDLWSTLARAAEVAAATMSCQVAVVRDGAGLIGATSSWGSVNVCDVEVLDVALDALAGLTVEGPVLIQDTKDQLLPDPFSWEHGTRSLMVIPIPGPVAGQLVVAHTMRAPRGFTDHCLRLGLQIADAAGGVRGSTALLERDDDWQQSA